MKRWVAALRPPWILLIAWLLVIAYAFPGYLNWDAGDQIYSARRGHYDDWHPPVMAAYWRLAEIFVRGPFGMLLLQLTLFLWGLYAAFRQRFSERTAAWLAAGLLLFPPVLTPMAVVWKDAQMAAFLIAGTMLALRHSWWCRGAGVFLLLLAAGVRDNGAAALLSLCVLIVTSWQLVRPRVAVVAIGVALFVALAWTAMRVNTAMTDERLYPWFKTVAIHDLAGVICLEDPMTDDEVRELLDGVPLLKHDYLQARFCNAYETRVWFKLTFGGHDNNMFGQLPEKPERLARLRAWKRAVREHTEAWLSHRWLVMREVLGLTDQDPWEPVCQTFTVQADLAERVSHNASLSWFQQALGDFFRDKLGRTVLYRPWAYLLVGLALLGYAFRKRDGFLVALLLSGVFYEASYVLGAAAPDFRYSHWMIVCVCVAALTIFGERLRAARSAR